MPKKSQPKFISPKSVLSDLGLNPGETVVEYASGAGHWALAAATLVGPTGSVLALENDIGMLELLLSTASTLKLSNVDIEEIDLVNGVSKKANKADLVIVANTLYSITDKDAFAAKASKIVKTGGKLLLIDWIPRTTLLGPPIEFRLTEEKVIACFEKAGLKFACTVDTGCQHFGLVFDHVGEGCGWKQAGDIQALEEYDES